MHWKAMWALSQTQANRWAQVTWFSELGKDVWLSHIGKGYFSVSQKTDDPIKWGDYQFNKIGNAEGTLHSLLCSKLPWQSERGERQPRWAMRVYGHSWGSQKTLQALKVKAQIQTCIVILKNKVVMLWTNTFYIPVLKVQHNKTALCKRKVFFPMKSFY